MNIKQIDKKISNHKKAIEELQKQKEEIIKRKLILCNYVYCNKKTKLSSLIFVQQHWYEPPHGCSGGDNWHESNSNSYIICPLCKKEFANILHIRQDGDFLLKYKHLFKEVWERYDYEGRTVIRKPGD